MADHHGASEFDCCECGRHIITFVPLPEPRLCAACTMIPGWFTIAEMRAVLDPEHDGMEAFQRSEVPR